MNTIFLKKLRALFLSIATLLFIIQTQAILWANNNSGYSSGQNADWYSPYPGPSSRYTLADKTVENLIAQTYSSLHIIDGTGKHAQTQTLAYLDRNNLRANLNESYSDRIKEIGVDYFKEFFTSILNNECKFKDKYRVFYHGQTREFALLQDLYEGLNEIAHKKKLHDFILLRIPDKDFSKFTSIKEFLAYYIKNGEIDDDSFDEDREISKRLLAVNPSLFSNTFNSGECSFYYFLHSQSIASLDMVKLAEKVFDLFNYKKYFSKYNEKIRKLNVLLSASEKEKTGLLLQIFIPEKIVNNIAYRCVPWGCLYHTDKKPEKHPATIDLDNYKKGPSFPTSDSSFDDCQFRILINQAMLDPKTMLKPEDRIKFIRFCNQTALMKKYKTKLKKLLDKISKDVQAQK